MKNHTENSCKFGGDLLAYLYNEMPGGERDRFETHLADCGACTDEFAELSLAHYSVYEWQKLEFAPMETPEIAIPYAAGSVEATWFDKVRAAFAFSNTWATAGAAVAMLTLAAIGGFVVINRDVGVDVVQDVNTKPSPMRTASPVAADDRKETAQLTAEPEVKSSNDADKIISPDRKPITVPASVRSIPKNVSLPKPAGNRTRTAPTLNNFDEDEEDKSLRLADIFDDLDTLE